jgi:hypothetical protein
VKQRLGAAWKTSVRLVGWFPAVGSGIAVAGGMTLSMLTFSPETRLRLVETVVPLAMALTAAFLLSPAGEPPLELLLACPRPLAWALLERLAVATGMLGGVALAGNLVGLTFPGSEGLPLASARWMAPFVCLAGVALFTTQLTRQGTFGALLGTLLWGGMLSGGDPLLTRWPSLWPLHIYLQPTAVSSVVYALNRATLILVGSILVALAAYLTRDEERMLGIRGVGRKK